MADPWWKAQPQDLHRVEDRVSSIYVERTHIDREDNAVVLINKARTVRVPAALCAVMLIGPGTRITHGAVALLADSGTAVCWVGERGVRMYAGGLGPSRGSHLLLRQAYLVSRHQKRLDVARRMYAKRFPGEDTAGLTMQQLRGREGARVRQTYRQHSARTGISWTRREYKPGDAFAAGDDVNRVLSALNSALYGVCHAVIIGVGASPALGFVHTGSALSFVLDIADLYKADYSIPLAFDLVADGLTAERTARTALRDKITANSLMSQIVADLKELLLDGDRPIVEADVNHLWDEELGHVPGGVNWSSWGQELFNDNQCLTVIGPDLDEKPGDTW